jgi:hypothetical protein
MTSAPEWFIGGTYSTLGLRYAKSIATYDCLLSLLKARIELLGAYPERVACCLYLMGRKQEARVFVEAFLPKEPRVLRRLCCSIFEKACQGRAV